MHRGSANAQSMWPSKVWVIVPGSARIPTHASEHPTASLIGRRTQLTKSGTITIPPPTPSSPLNSPAASPIVASRHQSARIGSPVCRPRRRSRDPVGIGLLRVGRVGPLRRPTGPVGGEPEERGRQEHEEVAVAGDDVGEQRAGHRRGAADEGGPEHDPPVDQPVALVAQRPADRRRDDRRQRAADRLDRAGAECPDRGRRDDRATDAEHPREQPGEEPGDEHEDGLEGFGHEHRPYRRPPRLPCPSWPATCSCAGSTSR